MGFLVNETQDLIAADKRLTSAIAFCCLLFHRSFMNTKRQSALSFDFHFLCVFVIAGYWTLNG